VMRSLTGYGCLDLVPPVQLEAVVEEERKIRKAAASSERDGARRRRRDERAAATQRRNPGLEVLRAAGGRGGKQRGENPVVQGQRSASD